MIKHLYRLFRPEKTAASAVQASYQRIVGACAANPQEREIEDAYAARLNALMKEAEESRSTYILIDVMTWALASSATRTGNISLIGDIVRCLGAHVVTANEWCKAQANARKELEKGVTTH